MRIISCLTTLCLVLVFESKAQDESFSDYRRKTESFAHIYDKGLRGDLATFTIGGIEESVGRLPLVRLPISSFGPGFLIFDSNHVQVIIRSAPFIPSKHKLQYEGKRLVRIDNKPYYGNYGKLPSFSITSVLVLVNQDTVAIPANAYQDLFNPSFVYRDPSTGSEMTQDGVYLSSDKHGFYIYLLTKDDAGSYEVTWVIQDKKYIRRILDWGFTN